MQILLASAKIMNDKQPTSASVALPVSRFMQELKFLVTQIGCGIAGFVPEEIAPLFRDALDVENIILPRIFVEILQS